MRRKVFGALVVMLVVAVTCSFVWAEVARPRAAGARGALARRAQAAKGKEVAEVTARPKLAMLERFLASLNQEQRRLLWAMVTPEKRQQLQAFFRQHPLGQMPGPQARQQVPGRRPRLERRAEVARQWARWQAQRPAPGRAGAAIRQRQGQAGKPAPARQAAPVRKPRPVAKKPAAPKKQAKTQGPAVKRPAVRPQAGKALSPQELFKRADRNHDGKLTLEEAMRAGLLKRPTPPARPQWQKGKKPAPTGQQMRKGSQPRTQNPTGAKLAGRSGARQPSVTDREVIENWDILKDLLSTPGAKQKK